MEILASDDNTITTTNPLQNHLNHNDLGASKCEVKIIAKKSVIVSFTLRKRKKIFHLSLYLLPFYPSVKSS